MSKRLPNVLKQWTKRGNYTFIHSACLVINPFKPNGISHSDQLDYSTLNLRVVGLYVSISFEFKEYILKANSEEPDQTRRSGSVVECLTRDRGVASSSLTGCTVLSP